MIDWKKTLRNAGNNDLLELGMVLFFAMTPFFAMANDLKDMSEVIAGGLGVAFVAGVVTIYRIWKGVHRSKNEEE